MAQPIISVYDGTNTNKITSWAAGKVKANNSSAVVDWSIWNNRSGTTDVSDLIEASVTTLDDTGSAVSDPVVEKWVQVLINTTAEIEAGVKLFSPIGGEDGTRPLRSEGVLSKDGYIIKGTANDGSLANSLNNYSLASVKISVPDSAVADSYSIRLRIQGYYT